tara:strand:- start:219 stop:458 length:240 start_codon:yes stop_codon:yes gene_type:complete
MIPPLNDTEKQERAIALLAIADAAEDKVKKGESPLDVQTFVGGARRELARKRPDTKRMGEASLAAKAYKDTVDKVQGNF